MTRASIFIESFFDGFGPIGLFTRLHRPGAPTEVFAAETYSSFDMNTNEKPHILDAVAGLICGTVSFMLLLGIFTYLILKDHVTAAGSVLGAGVLAIVTQMIRSRLRS